MIFGALSGLFSILILSYISIATALGPWIAPLIVLVSGLFYRFFLPLQNSEERHRELALIQTVGTAGGLIAVGVGFTYPTLYFLDKDLFLSIVKNPTSLAFSLGAIVFAAGSLGMLLGRLMAVKAIYTENYAFPVSALVVKTITSQEQQSQARWLMWGAGFTTLACIVRDGIMWGKRVVMPALLPKQIAFFPSWFGRECVMTFNLLPMWLAIGFTTGFSIILPLFVGMISKYFVLFPLNHHSEYLSYSFFNPLTTENFTLAFASGMVLFELLNGIILRPHNAWKVIRRWARVDFERLRALFLFHNYKKADSEVFVVHGERVYPFLEKGWELIEPAVFLLVSFFVLHSFGFSLLAQLFLVTSTVIVTYQIALLAARIGLVPFGRFVTFVMLPALLFFNLTPLQLIMMCVFVSVSCAVASNLLFSYKIGQLTGIGFRRVYRYHWLGLMVTVLALGFCLWLLFNHLDIGSPEFFAQRAQARALLIKSLDFDWRVLVLGAGYGAVLGMFALSPTMVFGGLLMPNSIILGLSAGACLTLLYKNPKEEFPFWSGVFAAESLWLIGSLIAKILW